MILEDFAYFFNESSFKGTILHNEPMRCHTTMNVGGPARLFLEPTDKSSLIFAVTKAVQNNMNFFILGGGSNVVVNDDGLEVVISTRKFSTIEGEVSPCAPKSPSAVTSRASVTTAADFSATLSADSDAARNACLSNGPCEKQSQESHCKEQSQDSHCKGQSPDSYCEEQSLACHCEERSDEAIHHPQTITLSAGTSWGQVITYCRQNNSGGFEPFTGLSGTTGGAIYMNATCFGLTTSDNLISVEYLDLQDLTVKTYTKNDSDWGYKKSPFQCSQKIILSATFKVTKGFDEAKSNEVKQKRINMGHFKAPSSGSAFKNNPDQGIIAGKLIDECGLKGCTVGGAQIAPWHGNFVINPDKKATARDIKELMDYTAKTVFDKTGIHLESEILFV